MMVLSEGGFGLVRPQKLHLRLSLLSLEELQSLQDFGGFWTLQHVDNPWQYFHFSAVYTGSGLRWWVGAAARPKKALLLLDSCWRVAVKFPKSQMSASKICGCKGKILALRLLVIDVKLFMVFLTPLTGFLQLLVGSPQVFRAELRLQELEEEFLSCRVLQGLLQRETPLLYSLLTGLFTGKSGEKYPVKTATWSLPLIVPGYLENDFKLLFKLFISNLCGRSG